MESVYPLKPWEEKDLLAEQFKKTELPDIPLVVNVETGDNWEELFPFGQDKNKISKIKMFYLLYGQDTYRSREKLNELLNHFKTKVSGLGFLELKGIILTRRSLTNC